jgi:hypothetical protein
MRARWSTACSETRRGDPVGRRRGRQGSPWSSFYYLAFFSRNERGLQFWNEVLKYSDDQLSLI